MPRTWLRHVMSPSSCPSCSEISAPDVTRTRVDLRTRLMSTSCRLEVISAYGSPRRLSSRVHWRWYRVGTKMTPFDILRRARRPTSTSMVIHVLPIPVRAARTQHEGALDLSAREAAVSLKKSTRLASETLDTSVRYWRIRRMRPYSMRHCWLVAPSSRATETTALTASLLASMKPGGTMDV